MLSESLLKLREDFELWRSSGRVGVKVPSELRKRTLEELRTTSSGKVQEILSINANMLSAWKKEFREDKGCFIALKLEDKIDNYKLKFSNNNLSLEGDLSVSDWEKVLVLLK